MNDRDGLVARCPAKINLMLRVLGRMDDGYHELDTVFQAIGLWDRLELRPAEQLLFRCDDPVVPQDESNLVVRALRLLAERGGVRQPTGDFRLIKSIPAQGGLGGGSSDAAGALRLGAVWWGIEPTEAELHGLAAELGADVPFFLVGGTARGRHRGDRVSPIEPMPATPLLLGLPPFGVPTAGVFSRLAEWLTLPRNDVSFCARFGHKWPRDKDFSLATNDLEGVVFADWPELKSFRNALLEAGATRALLSGSGSTVFGAFATAKDRARAERQLAQTFSEWTLTPTQTVTGGVEVGPLR